MTTQALKQAGLYLGEDLTPADPSNSDGHFEDVETVALHDNWLAQNDSNWCHRGDLPRVDSRAASRAIRGIAARLGSQKRAWGVKDPRACLFLSYWFGGLDTLAGIFTYRHFANCYESLQRRHGNDLLLNLDKNKQSLALFSQPELALASWLAYNKGILAQVKRSPERCLLLSQHALISGYPLVKEVNQRFETNLNEGANLRIDQSKVKARESVFLPHIEQALVDELHLVWEELQALAAVPSSVEPDLIWADEVVDSNVVPIESKTTSFSVQQAVARLEPYWNKMNLNLDQAAALNSGSAASPVQQVSAVDQVNQPISMRPPAAAMSLVDVANIDFNNRADVNKAIGLTKGLDEQRVLIEAGLAQYPDNVFLHGLLGKCLFNLKQWSEALLHLNLAASLDCDDPSVYFHAALWHVEHGNNRDAIRAIQLALGLRRNADHLILLINLHLQEREFEEAQRLTLLGYEWFLADERFVILHADALFDNKQTAQAIEWCIENDRAGESYAIARKMYEYHNQLGNVLQAKRFNAESQRRKLAEHKNYRRNASAILQSIHSGYARKALTDVWCDSLHGITTSGQPVVIGSALPSVAMSILVRDEVDIIESNIRFHADAGVEHFIVTDNASIDGTRDVLASLKNEFSIEIIDEPSHTIDQDLWVTRMARQLQMQSRGARSGFNSRCNSLCANGSK